MKSVAFLLQKAVKDANLVCLLMLVFTITTMKTLWPVQPLMTSNTLLRQGDHTIDVRLRLKQALIVLVVVVTGLVTDWLYRQPMAELKRLKIEKQELEYKYKQVLSSMFSCVNEETGFTVNMTSGDRFLDSVSVRCTRIGEWRDGQYYHYIRGKPVLNGDKLQNAGQFSSASTGR